jgi:hypothetical protein
MILKKNHLQFVIPHAHPGLDKQTNRNPDGLCPLMDIT